MNRKHLFLIPVVLICLSSLSLAQGWSSILDSSRAIDWSTAGVIGGIPNRTATCATFSPGATSAQINTAIASCPANGVVVLNAGTYNLGSTGILFNNKSNVTLRGAGADKTLLNFSGSVGAPTDCTGGAGTGVICVRNSSPDNWTGGPRHSGSWTGGYAKGTNVITLSTTSGLAVGNIIMLDQLDDSSDNGAIFVCTSTSCTYKGSSQAARTNRGQTEIKTVTAINGNQVTISPGLYMPNWRSSQSPGAWWGDDTVKGVGIEDLAVTNDGNAATSFFFNNAVNCWVKGVKSSPGPSRSHVWLYVSSHIEVRDSYFYGTASSASTSYGVETFPAADSLIENNIFQHIAAPVMLNGASPGTVVGYNLSVNNYYSVNSGWMMPLFTDHDVNFMELLEGNDGQSMQTDNVHGTHHFVTMFRNYFHGDPSKTGNTTTAHLWAYSRFFNIIGNVFGRSSYYTTYETNLGSTGKEIYSFGEPDAGTASQPKDAVTRATVMRWGNYDTVSGASRFVAAEVPSAMSGVLAPFSNAVPANNSLPDSFYLRAKPAFWGSMPWPAIGPDVSGGNGPGGHSYDIPATSCYLSVMGGPADGSGAVLNFNADKCYGSGGGGGTPGPVPPSGLTASPK